MTEQEKQLVVEAIQLECEIVKAVNNEVGFQGKVKKQEKILRKLGLSEVQIDLIQS